MACNGMCRDEFNLICKWRGCEDVEEEACGVESYEWRRDIFW